MNSKNMSNHSSLKIFGKFPQSRKVGRREDLFFFYFGLHQMFGENWTSEGVKTFFFWSSPDVTGKLDVGRCEDVFFWSSLDFGRKIGHLRT